MSAMSNIDLILNEIMKSNNLIGTHNILATDVKNALLMAYGAGREDRTIANKVMKQADRLHELPHWGYDLVINLNNVKDAEIVEGRNQELLRVAIYRKGKRAMLWLSLIEDNGKIKARMTTTIPGGKEDHKISQIKPWVERNEINKTSFDQDQK